MPEYLVTITESSKELSAKERVRAKDFDRCITIGKACKTEDLEIDLDYWVSMDVHNEKSTDVDYHAYVLADKDGTLYQTGSESFWRSFIGIWEEFKNETDPWTLLAYSRPSKNREGQSYLTCTVQ